MDKESFKGLVNSIGKYRVFCEQVNIEINDIFVELPVSFKPVPLNIKTLTGWVNRNKCRLPPAEYVRPIVHAARAAGVDIDEHKLRPDLYPYPLKLPTDT